MAAAWIFSGGTVGSYASSRSQSCVIHLSFLQSADTISPACNVLMSNGVLGIPPAAGKNISADPFLGCL